MKAFKIVYNLDASESVTENEERSVVERYKHRFISQVDPSCSGVDPSLCGVDSSRTDFCN